MGTMRLKPSNGCWLDLFDQPDLTGNHCRLIGPADFPGLRIREAGWGEHAVSLAVGPAAYVQCFDSSRFHDSVFWLLPNQQVERVEHLDLPDAIDSIRLFDRPPFAHEPGYAAYMLWAASHLARLKA